MLPIHLLLLVVVLASLAVPVSSFGEEPELPPNEAYVVVNKHGQLSVNGERQRYWAVIGKLFASQPVPADASDQQRAEIVAANRRSTDALIQRFQDLGFNSVRMWKGFREGDYTPGDGSTMDNTDYFIAQAKKAGFRIWLAGMNRVGYARPDDADIIDEPGTADAWAAAVRELHETHDGYTLRKSIEKHWDPRMEALLIRDMAAIATHMNHHTGLRWCDDPVFAVWEISNEEWWMRRMVAAKWQKLPEYFRESLIAQWQDFLHEKYGSTEKLAEAWGDLLDGESLESGSVLLAPMAGKTDVSTAIGDANPQAKAALVSIDQTYTRDDFARQRGADVLEFFMGLQLAHKQRVHAALKPLGKSTRLSPWIYDTGIGYEAQSQYLHQNADAVAHDAYINGTGPTYESRLPQVEKQPTEHQRKRVLQEAERIAANEGPWVNWLLKPPGISQGVPWLEHNRVEGKPFLVYETQIQQPAKYRADFPLRLLALASIQDWDWVSWHYFGGGNEDHVAEDPEHFNKPMDITTGRHPQGYHFTYDEVQSSMMRAAGHAFTGELLKPAPNPTVFVYGLNTLYDPASMDYGGSYGSTGLDMFQTVYQYGVRIRIDPTREDDQVLGPVVKFEDRNTHNPYTPTGQMRFDWKKGYYKADAPAFAAFTGFMAAVGDEVTFDHDVVLKGVQVHNPKGIYEPIDDRKYIAFAAYSRDRKPFAEADRVDVSLMSTSFNSGFKIDPDTGKVSAGSLPVLVARVSGTVHAPALDGMSYTLRDWHLRDVERGTVTDGKLNIPADLPVFVVELIR